MATSAVASDVPPIFVSSQHPAWTSHYENVLGTSMQITLGAENRVHARNAEDAALAAIDHDEHLLSAWRPESEFNRWLATQNSAEKVSPELFAVLGLFDLWRERTMGALDASAEAAVKTWRAAAQERRQPTTRELADAVAAMQQPHWILQPSNGTVIRKSATPLVLASFTKSYIAGRAADASLHAGASGVMLNIGGDIVVRGDMNQLVHIANPFAHRDNDQGADRIVVRDRSVATSGSYRRGFDLVPQNPGDAPQFSHIIDPRNAQPAGHIVSSTVIAHEPETAGALATAFSILTTDETRSLAASIPGTDYLLITRDGERVESDGWRNYQASAVWMASYPAPQAAKRPAAAATDAWNQSYELVVDLELVSPNSPRYRRPYVAVWVEDEDHSPVRTIALWYDKLRYLPELRDWAHDNQAHVAAGHKDVTYTVASATRAAGKYTLEWDGKDDEGRLLKPGKYTVCIEAAREHGGNQIVRQELNFNGTAQQHAIPAGAELGPVTLDYRKK